LPAIGGHAGFCRQAIGHSAKPASPRRAAQTRVSLWPKSKLRDSRGGYDPKRPSVCLKLRAASPWKDRSARGVRPVLWISWTTHKVESLEDALRIVLVPGALDHRASFPHHENPRL